MRRRTRSAKPADGSTCGRFGAADGMTHDGLRRRACKPDPLTLRWQSCRQEDDDTCCGDARTSETCKRALKALDFDLSDHSSHGH